MLSKNLGNFYSSRLRCTATFSLNIFFNACSLDGKYSQPGSERCDIEELSIISTILDLSWSSLRIVGVSMDQSLLLPSASFLAEFDLTLSVLVFDESGSPTSDTSARSSLDRSLLFINANNLRRFDSAVLSVLREPLMDFIWCFLTDLMVIYPSKLRPLWSWSLSHFTVYAHVGI